MIFITILCLSSTLARESHSFQTGSSFPCRRQNHCSIVGQRRNGPSASASALNVSSASDFENRSSWNVPPESSPINPLTAEENGQKDDRTFYAGVNLKNYQGGGTIQSTSNKISSKSIAKLALSLLLAVEFGAQITGNQALSISKNLFSVTLWASLAPFASIALKMSPMPTILKVQKEKKVGGLPLLPYSAMATLTFNLVLYGILIGDKKVLFTHGIGHSLSLFYCILYIRNCPPNASHLPGSIKLHKRLSLAIVSFVAASALSFRKELASQIVGMTSVILSCIMYIGPLSRLRQAIKDKSAKDIPLPFAIVGFLNALSWFVYGFFQRRDFNLYAPCFIGLTSTTTQILLHIMWGNKEKEVTA